MLLPSHHIKLKPRVWAPEFRLVRPQTRYSTGTVGVVNGDATVTITGGTFPTWVGSESVIKIAAVDYGVASRGAGGTTLELDEVWAGATESGLTYEVRGNCATYQNAVVSSTAAAQIGLSMPGRVWVRRVVFAGNFGMVLTDGAPSVELVTKSKDGATVVLIANAVVLTPADFGTSQGWAESTFAHNDDYAIENLALHCRVNWHGAVFSDGTASNYRAMAILVELELDR